MIPMTSNDVQKYLNISRERLRQIRQRIKHTKEGNQTYLYNRNDVIKYKKEHESKGGRPICDDTRISRELGISRYILKRYYDAPGAIGFDLHDRIKDYFDKRNDKK